MASLLLKEEIKVKQDNHSEERIWIDDLKMLIYLAKWDDEYDSFIL